MIRINTSFLLYTLLSNHHSFSFIIFMLSPSHYPIHVLLKFDSLFVVSSLSLRLSSSCHWFEEQIGVGNASFYVIFVIKY